MRTSELTRDLDDAKSYQLITPDANGQVRASWDVAALDAVAAGVGYFVGPNHFRFTDEYSVIRRLP